MTASVIARPRPRPRRAGATHIVPTHPTRPETVATPVPTISPSRSARIGRQFECAAANRAFLRFAASHANCRPILAERDREIVGTGVATVSGRVGWVGTIWVAPALRGRGLGRALTEAVIEELEGSGCRTLVLVATEAGRPVYERLGFEILTHDHALVASGRRTERTRRG